MGRLFRTLIGARRGWEEEEEEYATAGLSGPALWEAGRDCRHSGISVQGLVCLHHMSSEHFMKKWN